MDLSEYLNEVVRIVGSNLQPTSRWVTAAALGTLLRKAYPNVSWKEFGYKSLFELLNDPLLATSLKIIKTDKSALAVTLTDVQALSVTQHVETYNPLRKIIWEAFTLPSPPGRRFMNRMNGSVRIGLDTAPAPADDWVEIEKIGLYEQKRWAESFVDEWTGEPAVTDAVKAMVASPSWHPHQFGHEMNRISDGLMRQWNRYRTSRVSGFVKQWLSEQNLPIEWAFQTKSGLVVGSPELSMESTDIQHSPEETKKLILSALSLMPVEQLLDIPIPSRFIIAALSSTKAR
ncbi:MULTISPECIES: OST-HTH/LOTUS domain-containing protein [Pseudomonas]|uniref:OST-HTH/LOTUS domain-containing protein n=1 Tax=Pseudomonas TaxID=286 RepID=UPI0030DDC82B